MKKKTKQKKFIRKRRDCKSRVRRIADKVGVSSKEDDGVFWFYFGIKIFRSKRRERMGGGVNRREYYALYLIFF